MPLRTMKNILFCLFYLSFIPIGLALQAEEPSNKEGAWALTAQIQDTYSWSSQHTQYHLDSSQFNFVVREKHNSKKVVLQDSVTNVTAEKQGKANNSRYLLVQSNKVRFISTNTKEQNSVPAKLSSNQDTLVVYFPKSDKVDILNGLLQVVLSKPNTTAESLFSIKNPKGFMSDYVCRVKLPGQLICVMDYHFDVKLPTSTTTSI